MKFVNRFETAEDQCPNGIREGLVFAHETLKGLQSTKKAQSQTWTTFRFYKNLLLVMSTIQAESVEGRHVS